jgi:hypothetical protein
VIADSGLKQYKMARELGNIMCEDCIGRVGGDLL